MDDRYLAAFDNYPNAEKLVVIGWCTTGEVEGEPIVVLVATVGHIITGYVDDYFDASLIRIALFRLMRMIDSRILS